MAKKKREKFNIVYSTNPDFEYKYDEDEETETLDPSRQKIYVSIDRKQRAGKEVTLVEGFIGSDDDRKELAKFLKSKCGVGGSVKENDIIIQGKFKDKVAELLESKGYKVIKKGGN